MSALVQGAQANSFSDISLGATSSASQEASTAVGAYSSATAKFSGASGGNSVADQVNTVSVGAVDTERRIVNIAAG